MNKAPVVAPPESAPAGSAQERALRAKDALDTLTLLIRETHVTRTERSTHDCRATSCCVDGCEVDFCGSCGQTDLSDTGCLHRELLAWLTGGIGVLTESLRAWRPGAGWEAVAATREAALAHYAAFIEARHTLEHALEQDGYTTVVYCGSCQEVGLTEDGCKHLVTVRELCRSANVTPVFMVTPTGPSPQPPGSEQEPPLDSTDTLKVE